ncbi:MAG: GxxExxY protein [Phycisphaerales bacterium]|nr:GxxExxY protein [Phycisphaerales bacterium]
MSGATGLKCGHLTEKIIGIFYEVYNELGAGFLGSVYEHTMEIALADAGLSVCRQQPIQVVFRGRLVGEYRADLLVEGSVIVELKAASGLVPEHESQVLHYLRAIDIEVGLLFNIGPKASFKRLVFDNSRKKSIMNRLQPSPVTDRA